MKTNDILISVICCAHNEEEYIDKSMRNLLIALKKFPHEIIFIADRCTDNTINIVRKYNVILIEKNWKDWKNSYSESLQTGYVKAKGVFLAVIDVDIIIPEYFFAKLIPKIKGDVVSVAAHIVTYPDTFLNRIMYAWEKTRKISPLGIKPRGASRIILKNALEQIGEFRDVPAPDTDMDIRFKSKGYESIAALDIKVYHIRHISFKTIINGQITSGRARYVIGISLLRTVGHALFRFRPLVIFGWLLERKSRKKEQI
jgi:glycosyltransferase involved in cell wall biosynthesis